jgi:predicted nucleic acid-binding protein
LKVVSDTDLLSTFSRIDRLDILSSIYNSILVPPSVALELKRGEIKLSGKNFSTVDLTREEIMLLGKMDSRLGRGERECLSVAKFRKLPLASNDRVVHQVCKKEKLDYFNLQRLLRFAILREVLSLREARDIVRAVELNERTLIKNQREIFK